VAASVVQLEPNHRAVTNAEPQAAHPRVQPRLQVAAVEVLLLDIQDQTLVPDPTLLQQTVEETQVEAV